MADLVGQGIGSLRDLLKFLTDRSRSADVLKNGLLRELRDNLQLLQHRNAAGANRQAIIQSLKTDAIDAAFKGNFKFHTLSSGKKVGAQHIVADRQNRYTGWDEKRLITSMEGKIHELRQLGSIFPDQESAGINIPARLDNLYFQILLLSTFIYSGK